MRGGQRRLFLFLSPGTRAGDLPATEVKADLPFFFLFRLAWHPIGICPLTLFSFFFPGSTPAVRIIRTGARIDRAPPPFFFFFFRPRPAPRRGEVRSQTVFFPFFFSVLKACGEEETCPPPLLFTGRTAKPPTRHTRALLSFFFLFFCDWRSILALPGWSTTFFFPFLVEAHARSAAEYAHQRKTYDWPSFMRTTASSIDSQNQPLGIATEIFSFSPSHPA